MTDRELLEMAAKAAGIELIPMQINNVTEQGDDRFIGFMTDAGKSEFKRGWFNPLTDDGDALRLAVKLNLLDLMKLHVGQTSVEEYASDPYGCTRRAIVRAAAAIGEQS